MANPGRQAKLGWLEEVASEVAVRLLATEKSRAEEEQMAGRGSAPARATVEPEVFLGNLRIALEWPFCATRPLAGVRFVERQLQPTA